MKTKSRKKPDTAKTFHFVGLSRDTAVPLSERLVASHCCCLVHRSHPSLPFLLSINISHLHSTACLVPTHCQSHSIDNSNAYSLLHLHCSTGNNPALATCSPRTCAPGHGFPSLVFYTYVRSLSQRVQVVHVHGFLPPKTATVPICPRAHSTLRSTPNPLPCPCCKPSALQTYLASPSSPPETTKCRHKDRPRSKPSSRIRPSRILNTLSTPATNASAQKSASHARGLRVRLKSLVRARPRRRPTRVRTDGLLKTLGFCTSPP